MGNIRNRSIRHIIKQSIIIGRIYKTTDLFCKKIRHLVKPQNFGVVIPTLL